MRILLVEDDEIKRRRIVELVTSAVPTAEIREARSRQSGMRALSDGTWALVILDMSMPVYDIAGDEDGGSTLPYGGRDLLRQMERRKIDAPVVVVTQFDTFGEGSDEMSLDEVNSDLKERHGASYLGAIYYHPAYDSWRDDLRRVVEAVVRNTRPVPEQ